LINETESWKGMARDTLHPSDGQMLLLLITRKEGLESKVNSVLPKDRAVIVAMDIFKPVADTSIPFRSRVILMALAPLATPDQTSLPSQIYWCYWSHSELTKTTT
jgi:hypothetical protein